MSADKFGPYEIAVKQRILSREKFRAMQFVSRELDIRIIEDHLSDMLAVRLETELLVDKIAHDVYEGHTTTTFPSSPWQFFKQCHSESWWLRWLVRRHPVRFNPHRAGYSVTWDKRALYPDARIVIPETLGQIVVHETVNAFQTYGREGKR